MAERGRSATPEKFRVFKRGRWMMTTLPDETAAQVRDGMWCKSGRDGECAWSQCPQIRDGEPQRQGRHCPLDTEDDDA